MKWNTLPSMRLLIINRSTASSASQASPSRSRSATMSSSTLNSSSTLDLMSESLSACGDGCCGSTIWPAAESHSSLKILNLLLMRRTVRP